MEMPLKPPRETYVDDPTSIEDVDIDELEFDLENGIKHINRLHLFHGIAILKTCLEDIIKLQDNKDLYKKFRSQQIDTLCNESKRRSALKSSSEESQEDTESSLCTPSSSKPPLPSANDLSSISSLQLVKLSDSDEALKDDTTDGSKDEGIFSNKKLEEILSNVSSEENVACPPFVPLEELIKSTSFETPADPITSQSASRIVDEIHHVESENSKSSRALLLRSFNLVKPPGLTVGDYLVRIKTYSPSISVPVYIHASYLMYKLCILLSAVQLTNLNVHRLLLALLRCLTKILEDIYQKQRIFAQVGGVSNKELFRFEMCFLFLSDFKLVTGEDILNYFLREEFVLLRKFCKQHSSSTN